MANATITATVAEQTVQENNDAIVTFHLSSALTSSTTVKVSVNPQGGATTDDYGTLYYHMGTGVGGWLLAPNDGVITINAGFNDFQLKTNITNDTITEGYDSLAFTVAQTTSSVGIADSWWVPSLVNLQDAVGTGTAALHRSITAFSATTGVEGAVDWTASGTPAIATYHISGAGGSGYSATDVRVSLYGVGGAVPTDFSGFMYRMGTSGPWLPATNNGTIQIANTATAFQLASYAELDSNAETGEAISFNVAQTTSSVGLVDSWWVPNIVSLQDAPGTGTAASPRTITAGTPITGTEGNVDWAGTPTPAIATFIVSGGGSADYALTTDVRVSMYGLSGAIPSDYSGFKYHMGTGAGGWLDVPVTGLIPIGRGDTVFQLASQPTTDSISETGEALSFTVAQTTSSVGLSNSWWVQSTVDLQDARGTGAVAFPRTITATSTTPGTEGDVDWTTAASHPAIATFHVTGGITPDYALSTEVRVSMYGTGGAIPSDYFGFMYRMGTSGPWLPATNNGTIQIGRGDTDFQLASYPTTDSTVETGEGISFTVAQTTSSIGLINSWWVQGTADILDAAAAYAVVTGAIGPDHFTGTGSADKFVIPVGSSKTFSDGATGMNGSDVVFTSGEGFDRITNFTPGTDKIDLPATGANTVFAFSTTAVGSALTEYDLITIGLASLNVALPANEIGRYTVTNSAYVYFLVNTSGNGVWTAADDMLIKIVGGAGVLATDFV